MYLNTYFRLEKLSVDNKSWIELDEFDSSQDALEELRNSRLDLLDETVTIRTVYRWEKEKKT